MKISIDGKVWLGISAFRWQASHQYHQKHHHRHSYLSDPLCTDQTLFFFLLLLQTLSFYQFSATQNSLEQLSTAQSWSTLPSQQLTPSSSSREEVESNGEVLYKEVYHLQGQQILLRRCPFSTFIIIIWTTWLIVINLFCTYCWNVYWRTWSFRACIFLIKLNFTSHWLCLDPLNLYRGPASQTWEV